jgi:flagellar motor switch protein FliM
MTQDPTLSDAEVSALMSGDKARAGSAQPFSFGGDTSRSMPAIPAIDRLNERLVRRLREVIEPFVRAKPQVTTEPTLVRSLADWQAEQNEFTSISLYSFRPMKGSILLKLDPEFLNRLVDAYYGGSGGAPTKACREFTATEEAVLARLCEAMIGALAAVWGEIVPVRPQLRSREANVGFAGPARADESVAVTRFTIAAWPGYSSAVEIVYPLAGLRSVEGELVTKSHDQSAGRTGEWRDRLDAALGEIKIDARTVLARPELTLAEVLELKVGDIISVSLAKHAPLVVAGRKVAVGAIGEQDGRAALRIERMEEGRPSS